MNVPEKLFKHIGAVAFQRLLAGRRALLLSLPILTVLVWAGVMMKSSLCKCDDDVRQTLPVMARNMPRELPRVLNVVIQMNETLFRQMDTQALLAEFAEYRDLNISFDVTPGVRTDFSKALPPAHEKQIRDEAIARLKATRTDVIIRVTDGETFSLQLFTLIGEPVEGTSDGGHFERKRVVEDGSVFNIESISAILRGWFDALLAMNEKSSAAAAPSPEALLSPDRIVVKVTGKTVAVRQPNVRLSLLQMEGAASTTYATQWLFGGHIGIAVIVYRGYAVFALGGIYSHVAQTHQDIEFALHKYPVALGMRRFWNIRDAQLGLCMGAEVDIYRRKLFEQQWSGKSGLQPSAVATVRFAWHFRKRFQLFVESGIRAVLREPVFDIVVHSGPADGGDTGETRRVVLYDARIIQPVVHFGVTLEI